MSQGVGVGVGAAVGGVVGGSAVVASVVEAVVEAVVLRVVDRVVVRDVVVRDVVLLVRRLVYELLCVTEVLLELVMPFSSYSAEGSSVVVSVASELLETLRSKAVVFGFAVVAAASSAARLRRVTKMPTRTSRSASRMAMMDAMVMRRRVRLFSGRSPSSGRKTVSSRVFS